MFLIYKLLTIIFVIFSPIFFLIRIFLGKEDFKRFLEKYCIYKIGYNDKETIWFHGASVGEILSVIPLIKKIEENKNVKSILLTSSTTSSASIFKKIKLKKTKHVYFPIDEENLTKKFIKFWKPKVAIFIDSEIWPNMIRNLNKKNIPIILINGRITFKSFNRWIKVPQFAKSIFGKIALALPQNKETHDYLKQLGVKKMKSVGNLKYFGETKNKININLKKLFRNRKIFCCASTHNGEESFIAEAHIKSRKKIKDLITIIIPRHIQRTSSIIDDLQTKNLEIVTRSSGKPIKRSTDIYIVDTYGEVNQFYNLCNLSFVGGSLIKHGGQNPLEPARNKNFIIHGPYTHNFDEVYSMLSKLNISAKINTTDSMSKLIQKRIAYKQKIKVAKRLNALGKNILKNNIYEINKFLQ